MTENDDKLENEDLISFINPSESFKRDIKYSELLEVIVQNSKSDQRLKKIFFWIISVMFSLICIAGLYVIFIVANQESTSLTDIGTVIAGFGSTQRAIVVLPTIIAKHLFPENSEEIRFNFMKDIKKFDIGNIDIPFDFEENLETSPDSEEQSNE